jgi:uncharacterized protein (DUF2062 family)
LAPILDLLRQGLTPEKIALSLAAGVTLGVFPVIGSTTLLCALAAYALGLNLPAIQLVNYLVYPLQIALLLPFLRAGEWLFGAERLSLSVPEIAGLIRADVRLAIATLWTATWHAVVVWVLVGPVVFVLLLRPITSGVRSLASRRQSP